MQCSTCARLPLRMHPCECTRACCCLLNVTHFASPFFISISFCDCQQHFADAVRKRGWRWRLQSNKWSGMLRFTEASRPLQWSLYMRMTLRKLQLRSEKATRVRNGSMTFPSDHWMRHHYYQRGLACSACVSDVSAFWYHSFVLGLPAPIISTNQFVRVARKFCDVHWLQQPSIYLQRSHLPIQAEEYYRHDSEQAGCK